MILSDEHLEWFRPIPY